MIFRHSDLSTDPQITILRSVAIFPSKKLHPLASCQQAWNTYQQQSYSEPHYDSHNDAAYNNGHEVNTTPFNNWAPETIAEWMQPQHQPLPPPLPPVTSISRQQVVANIPPLGEDQLSVQMQQHQSSLCDEFAPYLWPPNHCLVCQTPFTQYNELQSYCFPFWQVFKCKHRYTNCCTTCHATYCMVSCNLGPLLEPTGINVFDEQSVWDFSCCLPFPGPCPIGPEHHYEGHVVRNQDRTRQPHSYTPQFFCTPESQPRRENNYFLPSDDTLQSLLEGPVRSDSSGSLPSLRIDEGDFEREADSVGYIRKFRRIEPKSPDQNWRLVSKSLTRGPTGGPRFTGCKICGDKNTGDYYGAHGCCEGCRMFFKRCIKNNRAYRCIFGGNCNIRFDDRRKCCKGCRLRRCHKAGMSPELCKQQIESHAMRYRPEDVPTAVSNQQRVQLKEFCLRIPLLESSGLRVSDESNQEIDVSALDSPNGNINITAGSSISTHVVS